MRDRFVCLFNSPFLSECGPHLQPCSFQSRWVVLFIYYFIIIKYEDSCDFFFIGNNIIKCIICNFFIVFPI